MVAGPGDLSDKPSRRVGHDPVAEKVKDSARQRKIVANSSDKASRKIAPLIKAEANRGARRAAKVPVREADCNFDESAQAAAVHHRAKDRHWGSINAADHRASRGEERRILDETTTLPGLPKGRRRATLAGNSPSED